MFIMIIINTIINKIHPQRHSPLGYRDYYLHRVFICKGIKTMD